MRASEGLRSLCVFSIQCATALSSWRTMDGGYITHRLRVEDTLTGSRLEVAAYSRYRPSEPGGHRGGGWVGFAPIQLRRSQQTVRQDDAKGSEPI